MSNRSEHGHRALKNNGVSDTRAYNTDNTLASISFAVASIGNLTYGWDANKNKTSEAIAGTMSNYGFTVPTNGYDSEDRLVGFNRTSGLTLSWSLSAVGDWNSVTTNGTAETRTHGPTHELLSAGGSNVSTDTKGNITLIPSSLRPKASSLLLNWDFDNRLNTADVGNNSSIDLTYKFDAMGRRVFRDDGTTATIYVQAGQQTIADYTAGTAASSPTYRYVYASYIDEPVLRYKPSASESLYYHRNQQYSVVAVTNASAAIVERYAYSAYGVPTITNASGTVLPVGSVDNRYMYTGREWDSLIAQYHYRARMYDAHLGRFASRDPIGFDGGKWSLYEFLDSKALSRVDPTGLTCAKPCEEKDRRPQWQCCADSRLAQGVDFSGDPVIDPKTGMPVPFTGGLRGLTFCCDGRVVTCVYAEVVRARYGNLMAQLIIIHCINEHEREHIPDLDECPNECPDLRWGAAKKGGRTLVESECIALKKQIACLQSSLALCFGNMNCKNEVDADLRAMTNQGRNVCNQAKIAFP